MTNNSDIKDSIIKTTDEEGNIHNFKLIEVIEIDDNEYGVFEYIEPEAEESKQDSDEEELVIMRIVHKENNYYFEEIEDDDEFDKVVEFIEENEDELELE